MDTAKSLGAAQQQIEEVTHGINEVKIGVEEVNNHIDDIRQKIRYVRHCLAYEKCCFMIANCIMTQVDVKGFNGKRVRRLDTIAWAIEWGNGPVFDNLAAIKEELPSWHPLFSHIHRFLGNTVLDFNRNISVDAKVSMRCMEDLITYLYEGCEDQVEDEHIKAFSQWLETQTDGIINGERNKESFI